MHWSTEPFIALHEVAQESSRDSCWLSRLEAALELVTDDLKGFLYSPAKSEKSRSVLAKQVIEVEDVKYQLNTEFINVAVMVADDLNIDELVAAQLVLFSSGDANRLAAAPVEAAVALFYVRRQYILEFIRFALECASDPDSDPVAAEVYTKLCREIMTSNPPELVLQAFRGVEQSLNDLKDRENRGEFMGLKANPLFEEQIHLERSYFVKEHDTLGCILCGVVAAGLANRSGMEQILKHMATFGSYSSQMLAYFPGMILYFSRFDPSLESNTQHGQEPQFEPLFNTLGSKNGTSLWKCQWWRGALAIALIAFKAGSFLFEDLTNEQSEIEQQAMCVLQDAIDAGGIEFLMALILDVSTITKTITRRGGSVIAKYPRELVQPRVPRFSSWSQDYSPLLIRRVVSAIELLVETFITNLADVLKEMRLNEEDSYLAFANDRTTEEVAQPSEDLERFFLLVAILYRGRPDAGARFWHDTDGALYGFLGWARECQATFMSATFAAMLTSLAEGENCAYAAHQFLLKKPQAIKTRSFVASWESIAELLHYYTDVLNSSRSAGTTYSGDSHVEHNAFSSLSRPRATLDDDSLLVLAAYLDLIAEVADHCNEAWEQCWVRAEVSTSSIVDAIFDLMRFQTPLIGSLLNALASCVRCPKLNEFWPRLDRWAFSSDIIASDNIIRGQGSSRFETLITSVPEAISFTRLMLNALRATVSQSILPHTRFEEYYKYIVIHIFPYSTSDKLARQDQLALQLDCMNMFDILLHAADGQLLWAKRLNLPSEEVLLSGVKLEDYMNLLPFELTSKLCYNDQNVYGVLFSAIRGGKDEVFKNSEVHTSVTVVILAIKLISHLISVQESSARFDKPLLYNLDVIPHLALYAGSEHRKLSLASIQLLSVIEQRPYFKATAARKSRVLSILESVTDTARIRIGLIDLLGRNLDTLDRDATKSAAALLQWLIADLRRASSNPRPCVAHFLLGFSHFSYSLELDSEVGGIATGASLLDSVCDLLTDCVNEMNQEIKSSETKLARLCSEVLVELLRNPLSSQLVLEHMREQEYFLKLLCEEPLVTTETLWEGTRFIDIINRHARQIEHMALFVDFFQRRANFVEMLSLEVHSCARYRMLSMQQQYLECLLDFQQTSSRSILSFLDFLRLGDETAAGFIQAQQNLSRLPQGIALRALISAANKSDTMHMDQLVSDVVFAAVVEDRIKTKSRAAKKAKSLKSVTMDVVKFDVAKTTKIESEARALAETTFCDLAIRATQLDCLRVWCQLVPVLVTGNSGVYSMTFALEAIQTLVPRLAQYSRTDAAFCQPLASLLVLLLERYKDTQGQAKPDAAVVDRMNSLLQAAIVSIQPSIAIAELRTDLYVVCYEIITMALRATETSASSRQFETVISSGDGLLRTVCFDALSADDGLRLVSLVFLEVLATAAYRLRSNFVETGLVRYNLVQLLIQSISQIDFQPGKTHSSRQYEICVIKVTLSLFLQLAQTRSGAQHLFDCGLIDIFNESLFLKPEATGIPVQYDVLTIIFQVVAAAVISLGSNNAKVAAAVRHLFDAHQHLITSVFRADANSHNLSQTDVSRLAKTLIVLFNVVEYAPNVALARYMYASN